MPACRRSRKTLPGFENTGWFGIVAPTGTPKDIIQKVYQDTKKALESTELRARSTCRASRRSATRPRRWRAAMKEETALWARVVRERKIKVE